MKGKESQNRVDAIRRCVDAKEQFDLLDQVYTAAGLPEANIPALRLQADICFNRLKKVLPDLKAVEHTGDVNNHIIIEWNK